MIVCFVVLAIVTAFISRVAAGDGLVPGDVWLALQLQDVTWPGLDGLVRATNWLGQGLPATLVSLAIVIALFVTRFQAEALLVLAAALVRLLNNPLKVVLNSPRPTIEQIGVSEDAPGFGFPSGHAMGAMLLFGAIIIILPAIIRRRWLVVMLQAAAFVLILVTGFGRVSTGAHWPSDVLGGYLFGLLLLLPLGWLYHRYRWELNLRRWPWQPAG
ncbi:MAG: phosphatase PAP2 family protein [Chloroflexia bacterium]|nr:phosphatase PAP2 family protein [Chloroflexia bacterium]MDQ3412376.1 phosphatase PAP2 family protein [Chloroflexota bacterium]